MAKNKPRNKYNQPLQGKQQMPALQPAKIEDTKPTGPLLVECEEVPNGEGEHVVAVTNITRLATNDFKDGNIVPNVPTGVADPGDEAEETEPDLDGADGEPEPDGEDADEEPGGEDESADGDDEESIHEAADQSDSAEEESFDYDEYRATHQLPDSWTTDHIDQWVCGNGPELGRCASGFLKLDPTRAERPVSSWSPEEIKAGLQKEVMGLTEENFNVALNAYRNAVEVPAAWSARDLMDYIIQGLEPSKTKSGAWRTDVTRSQRLAEEWSTEELTAWADGEIQPAGVASEQKLAIELAKRLDLGQLTQDVGLILNSYRLKKNGVEMTPGTPVTPTPKPDIKPVEKPLPEGMSKMDLQFIESTLKNYAENVRPGRATTVDYGVDEERKLNNLFRHVVLKLSEDPKVFLAAMTMIRNFINENRRGVFEPTYSGRYSTLLPEDGQLSQTNHRRLVELFYIYSDENRDMRKQVDIATMLGDFPPSKQGLLLEFFQRHC